MATNFVSGDCGDDSGDDTKTSCKNESVEDIAECSSTGLHKGGTTDFPQQAAGVENTYEIVGGDFQGASFGPQNYHLTRKEGVFGGDFSGAHIGQKNVQKIVKNTYIFNYGQKVTTQSPVQHKAKRKKREEKGQVTPDSPESSVQYSAKRVKGEEEDTIQLSDSIRLFRNRSLCRQGGVYEGSQESKVYGKRPLAVKLLPYNEKNVFEAKTLLKLAHHPNVVSMVHCDVYETGLLPNIFIAMELCHSQNLYEFIQQNKNDPNFFDSDTSMVRGKQLVSGMCFIHENHIIHRDLKPHNVLLSLDNLTLKIADFGLSKEMVNGRSITAQSALRIGTDGYRAPETYNSDVISKHADIFSLGLVLFYLWSNGHHAFGEDPDDWNSNIKKNKNRDLSLLLVKDYERAIQLLKSMLEFEPKNRPTANAILCGDLMLAASEKRAQETSQKSEMEGILYRNEPYAEGIAVFDKKSESLLYYDPTEKSWTAKQELNEDMLKKKLFTAVVYSNSIFVLMSCKTVYKLDCSRRNAVWIRVQDMLEDHGWYPPAIIMKGCICIVGSNGGFGSASTRVEIYSFRDERWKPLGDMKYRKRNHAVAAVNDTIYCIGGWDDRYHALSTAEKVNLDTEQWSSIAPMSKAVRSAAAVNFGNVIYVAGGHDGQRSSRCVECYHTLNNQWTVVSEMLNCRCHFRAFIIKGDVYVIGGDEHAFSNSGLPGRTIEMLSLEEGEWKLVDAMKDMKIFRMASVALRGDRELHD